MPPAISALALPPLAAGPVSSEIRLTYVMRHFRMLYEEVPNIPIGYASSQFGVEIMASAGSFFAESKPYPAAPKWREWAGQSVPFFFDQNSQTPLLELGDGSAKINIDIISAAFYLLSGWQEYFADTRDRHGRFPYAASVQQQHGFVTLPVVNYYFDVLKTAIEHVARQPLRPRRWASHARFAAFITHDIDTLYGAWKAPAKAAIKLGNVLQFGQLLSQRLAKPDAWDNLEAVAKTVAEYGAKSTFFVLPESKPGADGTPNADYNVSSTLLNRLGKLKQQGSEIGLHGSIGTATDGVQLGRESKRLQLETSGLRFHYLRWEPRITPSLVDAARGFTYDSTLGFAEHFGFRNSYCQPFYPFNFTVGEAHNFLEIPLNVMDATLHHPNYLQLPAAEMLPALQPMFQEIEKFGGVATILWHNDHFDPTNTVTGPQQFAEIMRYLQQRGAAFLTGQQIVAEL